MSGSTGACAPSDPFCHRRRFRLVVLGPDAGLRSRRAECGPGALWSVAQRQRHRRPRSARSRSPRSASHINRRLLVFGGLWIFSAMLLLLALCGIITWPWSCWRIGGWGMLLVFLHHQYAAATSASDDMRGRVMGIWALVFGGMMPIGGLEAGIAFALSRGALDDRDWRARLCAPRRWSYGSCVW